jgi:myo-inositol 2-dehydrogenase/D-chiro-inositol 1-dehydrogenase
MTNPSPPDHSRRDFLKTTAGAVASAAAISPAFAAFTRRDASTLKVGIVGCGGRGTGAVVQALRADPGALLWAMGDAFPEKIDTCLSHAQDAVDDPAKFDAPESRRSAGFDAYQQVLDSGVDVIILTTPPAFRPRHLAAAVDAGVHIFCEKPVAVDAPGVRSVLDSARRARDKQLSIMSGFCWRYQSQMREVFAELHHGGVGDIRAVQCTYNTTGWVRPNPRTPNWSDTEFQLRNWQYFTPISGDHVVEQAVHAIDWIPWAMQGVMPTRCTAVGGRSARPDTPETGNVWDNFSATFEFDSGARAHHMCRHWPRSAADNTAYIMGTTGDCHVRPWRGSHAIESHDGSRWKSTAEKNDMYQQEHDELFAAIRAGQPVNDGQLMAHSTLMGIMARQAAYTGQAVTWDQIMSSEEDLNPEPWAWGPRPTPTVAIPGRTIFT